MTIQVDIAEAEKTLSELIARAEAGEEVVIARDGKPVVSLTAKPALSPQNGRRRLGVWSHLNLNVPLSAFCTDPDVEAWIDKPIFPEG